MTVTQAPPAKAEKHTEDVPGLLSRWQLFAVLACVLFAVLTAGIQALSWNANRQAANNTEQLVRVQNIQSRQRCRRRGLDGRCGQGVARGEPRHDLRGGR